MKYLYFFWCFFLLALHQVQAESSNILGISDDKLRSWDVHLSDIPLALRAAIDFFMAIAGTISVIFIIIWAYRILFGSAQQDKTKGRDTIFAALTWLALAALAWTIVKVILANLS